jgi:hypothetical protein
MGTLTESNPSARELVTEVLDEALWWNALKLIVEFLAAKNVNEVGVEFGFVLDRDLEGKARPQNQIIRLFDLECFIKRGLDEGTIEWAGASDFLFHPLGAELSFMLCNDADVHFASADSSLLTELAHEIRRCGIKVYDSGRLI